MSSLYILYSIYLAGWYLEHDEGDPACFNEWYDIEYQALIGE